MEADTVPVGGKLKITGNRTNSSIWVQAISQVQVRQGSNFPLLLLPLDFVNLQCCNKLIVRITHEPLKYKEIEHFDFYLQHIFYLAIAQNKSQASCLDNLFWTKGEKLARIQRHTFVNFNPYNTLSLL